ncbi:hypothetical protein ACT7DE_00010 [Bacillus paranthracis]
MGKKKKKKKKKATVIITTKVKAWVGGGGGKTSKGKAWAKKACGLFFFFSLFFLQRFHAMCHMHHQNAITINNTTWVGVGTASKSAVGKNPFLINQLI